MSTAGGAGEHRGSTILVVDDHPEIRLMFELALSAGSYRTLTAANGQEALDIVARDHVDLMLLDIMMPLVSGEEVLRRLGPAFESPIVVVTGLQDADDADLAHFLELGAIDAFQKPFDMGQLLDLVESMLATGATGHAEYRRRRLLQLRGAI